jgi:hypothetical protein
MAAYGMHEMWAGTRDDGWERSVRYLCMYERYRIVYRVFCAVDRFNGYARGLVTDSMPSSTLCESCTLCDKYHLSRRLDHTHLVRGMVVMVEKTASL